MEKYKIDIIQDSIIDLFLEDYKSGKLKNRGEEQLAYAVYFFQLEILKRGLINDTTPVIKN